VIIDDDLKLHRRRDRRNPSQRGSASRGITDALGVVGRILNYLEQGYAHGGVSMANANYYAGSEWKQYNTRACGLIFHNKYVLWKHNVRFDAVQEHQALHVTLSLLELGYKNVVDYEFMFGHVGTNAAGGCSTYRTVQYLRTQNEILAKLHPWSVRHFYRKLTGDTAKAISSEEGVPAVKISWKKAINKRRTREPYPGMILCSG